MYTAAVFLPLVGAIVAGLFGRQIGDRWSQFVSCGLMIVSAILSVVILYTVALADNAQTIVVPVLDWINSGSLEVGWALRFDTLSALMLFVVAVVSALIHEQHRGGQGWQGSPTAVGCWA